MYHFPYFRTNFGKVDGMKLTKEKGEQNTCTKFGFNPNGLGSLVKKKGKGVIDEYGQFYRLAIFYTQGDNI